MLVSIVPASSVCNRSVDIKYAWLESLVETKMYISSRVQELSFADVFKIL